MRRRGNLVVVAFAALAITVAGCGSSSSKQADKKKAPKVVPATTTTVNLNQPNDPNLRSDAFINQCISAPGGWQAIGSAINNSAQPITLDISVLFANQGGTVEGTGTTTVKVPAHTTDKPVPWTAKAAFTGVDPQTHCNMNGVAAAKS